MSKLTDYYIHDAPETLDGSIAAEEAPEAEAPKPVRNKSVGFKVVFPDGTVFHEKEAVYTFIKALQKIGLARIASDYWTGYHT